MVFSSIGFLATASRMAWAFAREGGLPGSGLLSQVNESTKLPIYTICLSTVITLLLALINIGSSTAFNALTSLVVAGFYSTFILSASVLLHKRLTTPEGHISYGPFNLGRFGVPIIVIAIIYSLLGVFFSFWPPIPHPNAVSMNWSIVVFGGTLILSVIFWAVYGRNHYKGELVEVRADSY
jgi:choline transport protein